MKRDELTAILRECYKPGRTCGVQKIPGFGFENVWFVVPPAPPRSLPKDLPANAIGRANQPDTNEGKSERASVLGYAHALEKEILATFKKSVAVFSMKLASRLHKEVILKDPAFLGVPGQIRKTPVFIGGLRRKEESIYNPTPPKHIARCLNNVMNWMQDQEIIELGDAGMGMPLPVRMAVGHAHFEAVHPFEDGNGRVGRMLMTLQMASHRVLPFYISGYIEAEKSEYGNALQMAQKKLKFAPIVEFICEAIISSYKETQSTKTAIQLLPEQWAKRGLFRKGSAANRLLTHIVACPIFSVKQVQKHLRVSKPAANSAVRQLVKARIIRERTGSERYRIFAAEEVLELLARGFSEQPEVALLRAAQLLTLKV